MMTNENLISWRRNPSLSLEALANEPRTSISSLQREMNKVFNSLWSAPPMPTRTPLLHEETGSLFTPRLEMLETKSHLLVSAELPGVKAEDLELTLSPDGTTLSLYGKKLLSKETRENDLYFAERLYGSFRRSLLLPVEVNPDLVEALFRNGVLEINLEKKDASATGVKHIAVTAGA